MSFSGGFWDRKFGRNGSLDGELLASKAGEKTERERADRTRVSILASDLQAIFDFVNN